MNEKSAVTSPRSLNVAVIGKPNTGKSTLFSAISGIRVRTGNYTGVTVERKIGRCDHRNCTIHLIDVPGTYSLTPYTADESITADLLQNGDPELGPVDLVLCVIDATQLERGLFLLSQLQESGHPVVVALNMHDVAQARGIEIDTQGLSRELGQIPIIPTVASTGVGIPQLLDALIATEPQARKSDKISTSQQETSARYDWAACLSQKVTRTTKPADRLSSKIDSVLVHWFGGTAILLLLLPVLLYLLVKGVEPATGVLEAGQAWTAGQLTSRMEPGPLRSLLVNGVIAGVGGVLVFVPQIAILFLIIGFLEDCGYMARVALIVDRLMSMLGLSGKSFLPLLSSFACAVPGIMSTRTIENRHDRMITMLIAPLMSCSARLPVYTLLIWTFIPDIYLMGVVPLQPVVLVAMLSLGAIVAIPIAWILNRTLFRGAPSGFVLELPDYKWPSVRTVFWKMFDQVKEFILRAGTLILATAIIIWALMYFPGDHSKLNELESKLASHTAMSEDEKAVLQSEINAANQLLIEASYLGQMGRAVEPIVRPCGWDWRLGTAVIASFPAREVVIATLGTIFSLGSDVDVENESLRTTLREAKRADGTPVITVPVAISVMIFFALCAQCVSTLVILRRESGSWRWPIFCFVYMTALAYVAAVAAFQLGSRWGTGA